VSPTLASVPEIRDLWAALQFVTETLPLRSETDFAAMILLPGEIAAESHSSNVPRVTLGLC